MILVDLFSMILRLAELAFAAIVAGLTGYYLHSVKGASSWSQGRFIYTEVVAGLSILLSIIWLFPFSGSFIHWPVDLIISICWWASFGLLVNYLNGGCGNVFNWGNIGFKGANTCPVWKADIAFVFLSALLWLVSALLGIYWVHRKTTPVATHHRRRWYRSSRV
ncbi:putative integral membrane protein [Phialemonium atrogriseum]|uniref:Integral membrane protein n=1 Tax=Phialemonium atrogriseum TaxID=1093897 RepID=A0AAJ0CBA8_9PEZI|nr:putative integral membrane protein [Phialemonium atrogriseum]KAK1771126.1 putative integral membrane protein [Phialemonium atrogriseum]